MSLQDFVPVIEVLRWPAAFVVVGIVALLRFNAPVTRLLDRTRKISRDGVEVEAAEQAEKLQAQGGPEVPKIQTWSEVNQSAMLLEQMDLLRKDVNQRLPADAHEERENILVAAAATQKIIIDFLHLHRLIYGSQLEALHFLNAFSPTEPAEIEPYVEKARADLPDVTFESWLEFLLANVLVLRNEQGLSITVKGREFLGFLARSGLSGIPKPF